MTDPHYKRGTIRKDGKLYGRYPDGSLYRIYSTALSARYDGWAGLYDEHGQHTIVLIEYD